MPNGHISSKIPAADTKHSAKLTSSFFAANVDIICTAITYTLTSKKKV
jgi:hypothetical protein